MPFQTLTTSTVVRRILVFGHLRTSGSEALIKCNTPHFRDLEVMLTVGFRFDANRNNLRGSCSKWGVPNNSDNEMNDLQRAIQGVSQESGVDARYIFAIVMQESGGCVRAPTSANGVRNPGLMQDHNGAGTCNENGVRNPCPYDIIYQMIKEGTMGTPSGDGLTQLLNRAGRDDMGYYKAARMYNSGSIDPSGDLGAGIATHCYASDIANRLTGWVNAPTCCPLDGYGGSCSGGSQPPPGNGGGCHRHHQVHNGESCWSISNDNGISLDQFFNLNPSVDRGCRGLQPGQDVCIG
jgi:LysM domain